MEQERHIERLLPRFSLNRPVTVTMILVALLVIGFISYTRIKQDLFPSGMNPPFMGVWVPYPDANPKEIEEQIVKPMEAELKTVKDLKRLFNNSTVRGVWFFMEFSQGTNMDLSYAQVTDRVERARPFIPDEIEHIYIRRFRNDDEGVLYAAVSFDETVDDPYYVTEQFLMDPIEGVKGVASVDLWGVRERYIQIIIDLDRVRTYRINLYQLMQRLMQDNFSLSGGDMYLGNKKYMVRVKSRFTAREDIENIQIRPGLRLKNIARVVYDFDEELNSIMRVDGRLAAGIEVFKESQANTVEVCQAVVDTFARQVATRKELKGVDYFVFWDQGAVISESIGNVQTTGLWGGVFAFFVLFFFLKRFRVTIMLTLAIPLSLMISILIMYFMGWTLNTITLMGLMLSIGLVVDNSIVITENVYRFNAQGVGLRKASLWGASEVGLAITLATLTTIVVFVPLMIMGGESNMSFILIRIGAPVIFALVASLFIALVFIPLASTKAMVGQKVTLRQPTHNVITQQYQNALVKVLKHRTDALIVILVVVLSLFIPLSGIKMTDEAEGGPRDARVIVDFPTSYSIEKRDKILSFIADKIRDRDEIYHIDHISTRARGFHGRIEVYLKPDRDKQWYQVIYRTVANALGLSDYRRLTREELTQDIKSNLPQIPGVRMRTSWRDEGGGDNSALVYTLRGYDIDTLAEIADNLEKQLMLVEGVLSVENAIESGNDEIHIDIDREMAYRVGVNPRLIGQYVAFNLRPQKISNYHTDTKEIPIYVKTEPDQRQSVNQLKNTYIRGEGGEETNLGSLMDLTYHKSLGNIRRENGKTFLELSVYTAEGDMRKLSTQIERILKNYNYPTGYSYERGQRFRLFREQQSDFANALRFSIILVFIIMGILFESFTLPISVLVAIPAAFVGSFWLLFITGTTMDIMAMIGLVVLVGVVVNNAIVLIDLINQYRQSGMSREQAILVAGMHRFRPILMTALTTIGGLLPMAIGNASLVGIPYAPLGITMIGGLISSTFLTLFAVPVFYTYFDDMRGFLREFWHRIFG